MKKINLSITLKLISVASIITVCLITNSFAQGGGPPFVKGSKTIGLALGAGVNYGYVTSYGGRYVNSLPAFAIIYDQGIINDVGPGTIGIGGIAGIKTAHYNYYYYYNPNNNGNYKKTWTNIIFGLRATYHLTLLKDKNNKFDPYGGVMLGFRILDYKNNDAFDNYNYNTFYPIGGAFVGAKYNFTQNFGVFAELGYDISLVKIGINFNF
jgi:hypothetical protein